MQRASMTLTIGRGVGSDVDPQVHQLMHYNRQETGARGWFCGRCKRLWQRKPRGKCSGPGR